MRPQSPGNVVTFASLPNAQEFLDGVKQYGSQTGVPDFPHCVWSWIGAEIMAKAFETMKEPTRDAFMTALRSVKGTDFDFMLDGTEVDATQDGSPAISSVVVQKFNGKGYATVTSYPGS